VLIERLGHAPVVAPSARIAATATVVGNVIIGAGCVIDYGVVIASSGPPVTLGDGVVVMANAVVRSVGGAHRPAFPVVLGADCLVGPAAVLAGCTVGPGVYIATQALVFHGAEIGEGTRLGAGSIVHAGAQLPAQSRVGLRQIAVPTKDGPGLVITSDVDAARTHLARADFFGRAFELADDDLVELHRRSVEILRLEAADYDDLRPGGP
jgi:carbonic anhydrase/acetyltransferase-like protein (isoleucine patch superfamily)